MRLAVGIAIVLAIAAAAVACARIGDDRFPKLPDGPVPDALDVTPDAGPRDAVAVPDAATAGP